MLIENKLGSSESPGQLLRYKEVAQAELPRADVIPVFLTLEGDEPSGEGKKAGYVSLPYAQVLELADRLVDQNRRGLSEDVQSFLDQYLEMLRRLTLQDEELIGLCKTIYRRHRRAIDLIVQYGSASQIIDGCEAAVSKFPNLEFWHRTASQVWFLPKAMAQHQEEHLSGGWTFLPKRFPVMWFFYYSKRTARLQLTMEVGPFADPGVRIRLLQAIQDAGFKFSKKALDKERKYTRLLTERKKIRLTDEGEPDEDEEYIAGLTKDMWDRSWDKGSRIVEALRSFEWK